MTRVSFFNKQALLLCVGSIVLGCAFLYLDYKTLYFDGALHNHGEIAYNIYKYNSVKINQERYDYLIHLQNMDRTKGLINYADFNLEKFGSPVIHRDIFDTIGYGVLLGLLWKATGSLRYIDIRIFQILIFSFLIFLFYQIAFILFNSKRAALLSCCSLLFFFPIVRENAFAFRDIWHFYGLIILLYGLLTFINKKLGYWGLWLCSFLFAVCQFIRPTLFAALAIIGFIFVVYLLFYKQHIKRGIIALAIFGMVNVLFFWIPFMKYNKLAYDQFFVGCFSYGLILGLGEVSNPWGFNRVNDEVKLEQLIKDRFNLSVGTHESIVKLDNLFLDLFKEQPFIFFKGFLVRILKSLIPFLPSLGQVWGVLWAKKTFKNKVHAVFTSPAAAFDFMLHYLYPIVFFLCGYAGIFLLWMKRKRNKMMWILLLGGIVSCWPITILSHIEERYIITSYALFSFFVGYFLYESIAYFSNGKNMLCVE